MADSFVSALDLEVEVIEPGKARARGLVGKEHLNSLGLAHGGYLYTLADTAFAFASNSRGVPAVAISAHIDYLQPAREGETLEAVATELHLGHRTSVYRAEVRRGETLLAVFTGTAYRMQPKQGSTPEEE